jgi:transposase
MSKAYSSDLRDRVVAGAGRGLSASGAARLFGVRVSSAIRWTSRLRETGSVAAKPCGDDTRSKLTGHATWLMELIGKQPDLTLSEIQQRLRADKAGVVGYGTVWRFFASRKVRFEKNEGIASVVMQTTLRVNEPRTLVTPLSFPVPG